jgi:hypothetical protein
LDSTGQTYSGTLQNRLPGSGKESLLLAISEISQVCEIPFRSAFVSGSPNARSAIPNTGNIALRRTEKSLREYPETFIACVSLPDGLLPSANRGVVHRIHQVLRVAVIVRVERPHK